MSRIRFENIFRCFCFSEQQDVRPEGMPHEQWRWKLVDDFFDTFDFHRKEYFIPSNLICADESISHWYELGGHWVNTGLYCYVTIDRKPENGCEIQNSVCGKSGIMLRIKLVKNANGEEDGNRAHEYNPGLIHG